ncbi:MAG: hypothetical protein OXB98_15165 [Bryobacterales bacterium]|nr:hypothetical protein [Bryobacterales bacterium]
MAGKDTEGRPGDWKASEMTLRDWFAGQALAALIHATYRSGYTAETAREAYQYAEAMMRERGKDEEE